MSLKDDIIFSLLCRKEKLNNKQQEFICDRIIKSRTPIEDLTKVHVRATTGEMCTCAYLRQTGRERDNFVVCRITPTRAMRQITNEEFLLDLIKLDYENFDNFEHDKLRNFHYETYLKVVVAYGNAVESKIVKYANAPVLSREQSREYQSLLGRQNLMEEDFKIARDEVSKLNQIRENERLEKDKFAEEQADFILGIAEEVRNERDAQNPANANNGDDDIM